MVLDFCRNWSFNFIKTYFRILILTKKFMKNFFVAACIVVAFASCTKDDAAVAPASNKEIIASSDWKVSKIEAVVNGATADVTDSFMEECDKDNFETFGSNGLWTMNNGTTMCDPSEEQVKKGTWIFSENETKLTMSDANSSETYQVESLSFDSFVTSVSTEILGIQTTVKYYHVKN